MGEFEDDFDVKWYCLRFVVDGVISYTELQNMSLEELDDINSICEMNNDSKIAYDEYQSEKREKNLIR